jgi:NB-ARC domain
LEAARADLAAMLQDRSVLIVIDDVWPGKSATVAEALIVPSNRSHFLLTTRSPQLARDLHVRDFPLDEMNLDQATALITRGLGRALTSAEQPDVKHLTEIVGGHPFALELATARFNEGMSWATLLENLTAEVARVEVLEEPDDELTEPDGADEAKRKRKALKHLSGYQCVLSIYPDSGCLLGWVSWARVRRLPHRWRQRFGRSRK